MSDDAYETDHADREQGGQQMECPECAEDAVHAPTTDLVPWEDHGLALPEWSHRDGSSLCPVIGRAGGYEPAEPQARNADPTPEASWPGPRTDALEMQRHEYPAADRTDREMGE